MRIAFVLLDAEVTGGQVVAHELMLAARAAGHEPVAVFPRTGPMVARVEADGFPTRLLPLERSFRVDQALALARLLRRDHVDLVDTHTLFVGDQLSRVAARLARVPLVAHAHIDERFSTRPAVARLQRRVAAASSTLCAAVVAVSEHVKRTLVANGVPPARVTVVHNGIRLRAEPPPAPDGPLALLCVARLAPVKGQATLLEALARVGGDVVVSFAGEDLERQGAYRRELEMRAAQLGVGERVRFLGRRDDVPALLERSHVLVLPSLDEGLPIVALEAMERGRGVVATAAGGTPEVVRDGETGLLVEPGSVDQLAAAIERLRTDLGLAARLGAAGRERVAAQFTNELMASRTLAVYAAASAAGGTTAPA